MELFFRVLLVYQMANSCSLDGVERSLDSAIKTRFSSSLATLQNQNSLSGIFFVCLELARVRHRRRSLRPLRPCPHHVLRVSPLIDLRGPSAGLVTAVGLGRFALALRPEPSTCVFFRAGPHDGHQGGRRPLDVPHRGDQGREEQRAAVAHSGWLQGGDRGRGDLAHQRTARRRKVRTRLRSMTYSHFSRSGSWFN